MTAQPSLASGGLDDLAAKLTGRIVTSADPDWDEVRTPWNLAVDQRPDLVAIPADAADVTAVIRYAAAAGLRVTPQGTGHHAGARGDLTGSILLRSDRMRELTVDPDSRTVRVGAGVLWAEVTEALAPYGLAGLAGSSGDVGVVGYTLGGGYSWLARRYGLAASFVTAAEVVTGDGAFHRVDADTEPELFWAVRGGAGTVGIVCALEFLAVPMERIYAGALLFPIERASDVLAAYEMWTRDLDESATTCARLLRFPPLPDVPEVVRGKEFAAIDGAIDAPEAEAERMLAPLRELGPVLDTFASMPPAGLGHIHMDPPGPVPGCGDGFILNDLTAEAIEALLSVAGPGTGCSLLAVDLRHAGGVAGRPDPKGGAIDHLPGRFLLFAVGVAPVPVAAQAVQRDIDSLHAVLAPWRSDRDYPNFREAVTSADRFYDPQTLKRLLALQAIHDPDCLIRCSHTLTA